jgi:hypothetical protein
MNNTGTRPIVLDLGTISFPLAEAFALLDIEAAKEPPLERARVDEIKDTLRNASRGPVSCLKVIRAIDRDRRPQTPDDAIHVRWRGLGCLDRGNPKDYVLCCLTMTDPKLGKSREFVLWERPLGYWDDEGKQTMQFSAASTSTV